MTDTNTVFGQESLFDEGLLGTSLIPESTSTSLNITSSASSFEDPLTEELSPIEELIANNKLEKEDSSFDDTPSVFANNNISSLADSSFTQQTDDSTVDSDSLTGAETETTIFVEPEPLEGDADGDRDIDIDDVRAIALARRTPATGEDDPRDLDNDGQITIFDSRQLAIMVGSNSDNTAPELDAELLNDTAPEGLFNGDGITSDSSISGTIFDDSDITSLKVGINTTEDLSEVIGAVEADGSFSLISEQLSIINGGVLEDGDYTIYLQGKDKWGNETELIDISLTLDTTAPELNITNPINGGQISEGTRLTGSVDGTGSDVANISYEFDNLEEIPISIGAGENFDVELDLTEVTQGTQNLAVTTVDLAGNSLTKTLTLEVVGDDLPLFLSDVEFSEEGLFVGETTEVQFTVDVANPAGAEIQLFELDETGNSVLVGELFDNGDLAKGDDIAGDGVFNNKFDLTPTEVGDLSFLAAIESTGEETNLTSLEVIEPITDEEFQAILDFNTDINNQFQSLLDSGTTVEDAFAQIKISLEASPLVKPDSIVTLPNALGWETTQGIGIVLDANQYLNDGERSGTGNAISTLTEDLTASSNNIASNQAVSLAASPNSKGCNKALVLAPYFYEFDPNGGDESNEVAQSLRNAGFDVVDKYNTTSTSQNITVDDFKNLDEYDSIVITTHGDNFDGTNFGTGNDVVILTGQKASIFNQIGNLFDLLSGRLVLTSTNTYAITPSFITKHTEDMPNSIVYVGSCRSTFTNTLASTFISEGASAFIGYSDYVGSGFANTRGQRVFDTLLNGKTTGDIPGINVDVEIDSDPARFDLIGSKDATISLTSLKNGTFEDGDFKCWTTEGDTRIISALGSLAPPEGNRMAIISTGLGSVSDSQSSISQKFLVADNADQLKLTYNVISEEPLEFVGSEFDDQFQILLDGNIIAQETINTSSWSPVGGINFAGGDDTVFQTGFKTISVNLSAYKGQSIELEIQTFDLGDSIYDTAALIDNIDITTT